MLSTLHMLYCSECINSKPMSSNLFEIFSSDVSSLSANVSSPAMSTNYYNVSSSLKYTHTTHAYNMTTQNTTSDAVVSSPTATAILVSGTTELRHLRYRLNYSISNFRTWFTVCLVQTSKGYDCSLLLYRRNSTGLWPTAYALRRQFIRMLMSCDYGCPARHALISDRTAITHEALISPSLPNAFVTDSLVSLFIFSFSLYFSKFSRSTVSCLLRTKYTWHNIHIHLIVVKLNSNHSHYLIYAQINKRSHFYCNFVVLVRSIILNI